MLLKDKSLQWTVTTPLYNIGEQVHKLSPEFKLKHPEIIWNIVSGLRHRLVHDYDGVNWSVIVEVVFGEMDQFIDSEKLILQRRIEWCKAHCLVCFFVDKAISYHYNRSNKIREVTEG